MSTFSARDGTRLQVAPKPRPLPPVRPSLAAHLPAAPIERRGSSTAGLKTVCPENHPGDPLMSPRDEWEKDREAFHLAPPPEYPAGIEPRRLDVVFIGAGLGGIMFTIQARWRLRNVNFKIFEKNMVPSGTWFENRYPGCRCDVASHIYSLRIEPWDWTEGFGQWDEIYAYMRHIATKYEVDKFTTFETAVVGCKWEEERGKWIVTTEGVNSKRREVHECDVLVNGQGVLNRPKFPDIPGLHDVYKGSVVHTANWNTATDDPTPTRRVGVIGNGSTGLQVAGAMIDQVKEFWHFVRTPTYIQPYLDPLELTPEMREEWRRKGSENEGRAWRAHVRNIWLDREKYFSMFSGRNHKLNKLVVSRAIANMEKQVADPKLRAQLTPDFAYGCRRPIFHQTYYQLIQRPHAHLVTDDIVRCTKDGIITRDKEGKETYHGPMDQIVCATGFSVNWVNKFCPIQGRGGVTLETLWSERPEAYRSVVVSGFPNYMMLAGPNCPLTHNSLYIVFEQVTNWFMQYIVALQTNPGVKCFDVKKSAQDAFNEDAQSWLKANSVWDEDCGGWYKMKGYIAQWPGPGLHYMDSLYAPNWDHFDVTMKPIAGNRTIETNWSFPGLDTRPGKGVQRKIEGGKLPSASAKL